MHCPDSAPAPQQSRVCLTSQPAGTQPPAAHRTRPVAPPRSGHGAFWSLAPLALQTYYPGRVSWLMWLALLQTSLRDVLDKQHYSVDMVLAPVVGAAAAAGAGAGADGPATVHELLLCLVLSVESRHRPPGDC